MNLQQLEQARRDELAAQIKARQAAEEAEQERRQWVLEQIVRPQIVLNLVGMYGIDAGEIVPHLTLAADMHDKWANLVGDDEIPCPDGGVVTMRAPGYYDITFRFGIDRHDKYCIAKYPPQDAARGDGLACRFIVNGQGVMNDRHDHLGDALIAARILDDEVAQ